jgi:hypothetical protein
MTELKLPSVKKAHGSTVDEPNYDFLDASFEEGDAMSPSDNTFGEYILGTLIVRVVAARGVQVGLDLVLEPETS